MGTTKLTGIPEFKGADEKIIKSEYKPSGPSGQGLSMVSTA